MKVIFRTDASLQIGSGHVMRCLALADELRRRGAEVVFASREHAGNMLALIAGKGYQAVCLPNSGEFQPSPDDVAHASWLGVSWRQDTTDTLKALDGTYADWLVIDNYAIDSRWERTLRPHVGRIMVIDDLADRTHDCDLLLDQNLYQSMETRYDKSVFSNCTKLLGPKYALLRPEFAAARKNLRQRDGHIRRVLVFFGGVDPANETSKAIQALSGMTERQFEVDVVVGGGNIHKEHIQDFCSGHQGFNYHCQVDNMAELMAGSDLAIGAGGSTTWERCALGLPSLVIALADNQVDIAHSANNAGVVKYLGGFSAVTSDLLFLQINNLCSSQATMKEMSAKAWQLVDAIGAIRVADKMDVQ